jgi:hypothetical protein
VTLRGTFALAAVFALLCGYLLATTPPAVVPTDVDRRLVPSLDGATALEIEERGSVTRGERGASGWNPPAAGDLVATLSTLDVLTVIDPEPAGAAEPFGFGDALRLRVLAGTDELIALEIGATNPARTGVYVRRIGQPAVLLVGALLRWEIEKVRRVVSTTATP